MIFTRIPGLTTTEFAPHDVAMSKQFIATVTLANVTRRFLPMFFTQIAVTFDCRPASP
jgi:hypothetical protein